MMLGINIKKTKELLTIRWQLSKLEIPLFDILDVYLDDTYGGEIKEAIRIGTPYGTTDRVVIKTKLQSYILYTTNPTAILNKINN